MPAPLVVSSVAEGEDRPSGPAPSVGVDGTGAALFVWSALRLPSAGSAGAEPAQAIRARPASAAGVLQRAMDDPVVLGPDVGATWIATPTVAGLPEGGLVAAWTMPHALGDPTRSDIGSVLYRKVNAHFSLGPARRPPPSRMKNVSRAVAQAAGTNQSRTVSSETPGVGSPSNQRGRMSKV